MPNDNPSQNRPTSPQHAPDPAKHYDRAHAERESGKGQVSIPQPPADAHPDRIEQTVHQRQDGAKQLNAHDDPGGTGGSGQPLNQVDLAIATPDQIAPKK